MIPYLLHVALLLAVCFLCYRLLLQTETFYRLNRWVLLAGLALSFLLPLMPVPARWSLRPQYQQLAVAEPEPEKITLSAPVMQLSIERGSGVHKKVREVQLHNIKIEEAQKQPKPAKIVPVKKHFIWPTAAQLMKWMFILYWVGVAVFGLNLIVQLVSAIYQAYCRPAIIDGPYRIVELTGDKVPCSFLNHIFINPEKYDWDTYSQILLHEKVHVRQLHSIDILLLELAIIFQWFNPFAWLYRKEIENNLEYLTDEAVLHDENIDRAAYQLSLLKVSAPHLSLRITTNYNQSLLKKRILMMNAKKSNLHTLWKYFMLLPLFGCLACVLNQPAVSKNLLMAKKDRPAFQPSDFTKFQAGTEGLWYAMKVNDSLSVDFKILINGKPHQFNGFSAPLKDFSGSPLNNKGSFGLTRDAGTLLLDGKFEGGQGMGHFKLKPDASFFAYVQKEGYTNINEENAIELIFGNVTKGLIKELHNDGFTEVNVHHLSSLDYYHIDANQLRYWAHGGFKDVTLQDIVIGNYMHLDSAYAREIRQAGYPDISFQQLSEFKRRGVTAAYIRSLTHARMTGRKAGDTSNVKLSASEVAAAKYVNVDSVYMSALSSSGYNLTESQLHSFKSYNITPEYIKALQNLGYRDIPASSIISFKVSKINTEYLEGFKDIDFFVPANYVIAFKMQEITPAYVNGFKTLGYEDIKPNEVILLKMRNVTPAYVKSFEDIGYKNIELMRLVSLKQQDITPDSIKGFNRLVFDNIPVSELYQLKVSGVIPEYIEAMKQKGLNSKDLSKYITLKTSFN
jgi:hypothetical protein